jgi:CheY-like chemotaxis protein
MNSDSAVFQYPISKREGGSVILEKCVPLKISKVVLCVDDDPRALMARSLILSVAGYDVKAAASSDAAMAIFRRCHVDLVVADHFLPGIAGAALATAMKALRPQVRFVLLMVAPEWPSGSEQVDLVLIKGMDPRDFLVSIDRLLNGEVRKSAASC